MCPVLFHIGPLTLHTYGLMVALGFLVGYFLVKKRFQQNALPLALLDRLVMLLMIGGIVGARLLFFVWEEPHLLLSDPLSFFRVWEGGLVLFGGLLGGFAVFVASYFRARFPFLKVTDCFASPLLVSQALGRLGCFSAGCCYGKETNLSWGVIFKDSQALAPLHVRLHPTQLYEAVGDLMLFVILSRLEKRARTPGVLSAGYLLGYGILRTMIEFLRGDFRGPVFHGFFPSQIVSLFLAGVGILLFIYVQQPKEN